MNITLKAAVIGVLVAASMFGSAQVSANTGSVATPIAMKFFCRANASECVGGGGSSVRMTQDLADLLLSVTRRVNGSIRYTSESIDRWALNPSRGDCEDYVLSKRSALIRQGVAPGALRIAFTHTRRGVPHAVLVVKTSQGDYVLDNMTNKVVSLAASGYNIAMMSSSNPLRWVRG